MGHVRSRSKAGIRLNLARLLARRWSALLGCISLGVAGALLLAWIATPMVKGRLDARQIQPEEGRCYIARLPRWRSLLYRVRGDRIGRDSASSLILYENGFPLGPASTKHETIRRQGGGAYSHWEDHLYFSSADGSDPERNGRIYSYEVRAELRPGLSLLGLILALLGLRLLATRSRIGSETGQPAGSRPVTRRTGWLLVALGLGALAALCGSLWLPYTASVQLPVNIVAHAKGRAYLGHTLAWSSWPLGIASARDLLTVVRGSQLLEDDVPVGSVARNAMNVARLGEGRYVYSGTSVWLSTADGSDPRLNGRNYEIRVPTVPAASAWLCAFALLVAGCSLLVGREAVPTISSLLRIGPAPSMLRARQAHYADSAFVAVFVLFAIALLLIKWLSGASGHLGVAAYLPVSDAMGYFTCSVTIDTLHGLDASWFGAEFCTRRVLYPAMLGSLLSITGGRGSIALLLQAGALGLGSGVLFLALRRTFGWITASIACIAAIGAASGFAIGNFMTESLGMAAGMTAIALLLLAAQRTPASPVLLICGLALMSLAQFVRPGALLALPLLAIWTIYVTKGLASGVRTRVLMLCLAALLAGPLLQYWLVLALHGDPGNTGSNSAALLYGLSTGTRDWSEAYRVFAPLFASGSEAAAFDAIREAALANIRDRPGVFLSSLWAAGSHFARSPFVPGWLGELVSAPTYWAGLLICTVAARRPPYGLMLVLAVGELLSAPFVIDAGGHRVLAVTEPARVVLAGLAVTWIVAAVSQARFPSLRIEAPRGALSSPLPVWTGLALAAALVVAAIFPGVPAHAEFRDAAPPPLGICPESQHEVVTRLGGDTMQLTVGERKLPILSERLGIAVDSLHDDPSSDSAWWLANVPVLPRGTTFIHAIQRSANEFGKVIQGISDAPLPDLGGAYVSLCLAPIGDRSVKLGDFFYRRIASWHRR